MWGVPGRLSSLSLKEDTATASHHVVVVVQLLSRVWLLVTPWTAAHQTSLSFTISQSFLKLMSIESVMPSNFPSIRVFSKELALWIRWSKYWIFSFSISPSSAYSGLISFRMDWLDLPGTPRNSQESPRDSPRDSQESSPVSQFESINSSTLGLLYGSPWAHLIIRAGTSFVSASWPITFQQPPSLILSPWGLEF